MLSWLVQVHFTDGTTEYMKRRERPHLLFDPNQSAAILAIANGVISESSAGLAGDRSFTLVAPVKGLKTDDEGRLGYTIDNSLPRTDTEGRIVNAHQGHITQFPDGRYYWVGSAWIPCALKRGIDGCHVNSKASRACLHRLNILLAFQLHAKAAS